jgi:phytoene desaturase
VDPAQEGVEIMKDGKVGIVGGGPGGLACAMLLAQNGFDVTVFEQADAVGGRNAPLQLGGFTFDTGPTFLNMKFVLDELFELCGRSSSDYLNCTLLDPMYQLSFTDRDVEMSSDKEKMRKELERSFPGNKNGLNQFYAKERVRFEKIMPNLRRDFCSLLSFVSPKVIKALPYVFATGSIYDNLGKYFDDTKLRVCFTFQSKYLGMSPWECPAAFTMIPFVEHEFGIYHIMGGLNQLSQAMAKVVREEGGTIKTGMAVERLLTSGRRITGVELESGEVFSSDYVVINADFGYAFTRLIPPGKLRKYSQRNISRKRYSCSTFMLYLGIKREYAGPHHNIVLAEDYRSNINDIVQGKLSDDLSFYVQNACVTDKTLAPPGKSTVYVLVPVPNNSSGIDWNNEKDSFRRKVLGAIEARTPMKDISDHIEVEKTITPREWESDYNVYKGATFNLAHNIRQMLYFRPHNRFEELQNCYLVGGGTHPGSGLPTIYLSSMISAGLITKHAKKSKV